MARWLTDILNHDRRMERHELWNETDNQRGGNGQFNVQYRPKYWLETGKTTANATIIGLREIKISSIPKEVQQPAHYSVLYTETSTYLPDHTTSDFTKQQY